MFREGEAPKCSPSVARERAESSSDADPDNLRRCPSPGICAEIGHCAVATGVLIDRWRPIAKEPAPPGPVASAEVVELNPQTDTDLAA